VSEEIKTPIAPIKPIINKADFINNIKAIEAKIHTSTNLDPNIAETAIKAYTDFSFHFTADKNAPEYLFKAAELCASIGKYETAIIYYQTICNTYPNYIYAPDCLYLQGYIYDTFLNDETKAKEIYQTIILKYAKHKYAGDAKAALLNIGKTDEEIITEFKKKNKLKK